MNMWQTYQSRGHKGSFLLLLWTIGNFRDSCATALCSYILVNCYIWKALQIAEDWIFMFSGITCQIVLWWEAWTFSNSLSSVKNKTPLWYLFSSALSSTSQKSLSHNLYAYLFPGTTIFVKPLSSTLKVSTPKLFLFNHVCSRCFNNISCFISLCPFSAFFFLINNVLKINGKFLVEGKYLFILVNSDFLIICHKM